MELGVSVGAGTLQSTRNDTDNAMPIIVRNKIWRCISPSFFARRGNCFWAIPTPDFCDAGFGVRNVCKHLLYAMSREAYRFGWFPTMGFRETTLCQQKVPVVDPAPFAGPPTRKRAKRQVLPDPIQIRACPANGHRHFLTEARHYTDQPGSKISRTMQLYPEGHETENTRGGRGRPAEPPRSGRRAAAASARSRPRSRSRVAPFALVGQHFGAKQETTTLASR